MSESSTTSNSPENENNDVNVGDDRMMLVTANLIEKFNPPKLNLPNSFLPLVGEGKIVNMIDEFTEACGTHNVGNGETKTITLDDVIQNWKRLEEVATQHPSDTNTHRKSRRTDTLSVNREDVRRTPSSDH